MRVYVCVYVCVSMSNSTAITHHGVSDSSPLRDWIAMQI